MHRPSNRFNTTLCRGTNVFHHATCGHTRVNLRLGGNRGYFEMTSSKPSPSQLPKRAVAEIKRIMAESDGLDLRGYLSKWYARAPEDFLAWPSWDEKALESLHVEWSEKRPHLSESQRFQALAFHFADANLEEFALARRWALDDPAELAIGRCVAHRIQWINFGCRACTALILIELLAERDSRLATFLAENGDIVDTLPNALTAIATHAVRAIILKDRDGLRTACERMRMRKVKGSELGLVTTLLGICDESPADVAKGLQLLLDPKRRDEDTVFNFWAFVPDAHGLYRLAESVDARLVAEFDVTQGYPWDAEFHSWTQQHENPLSDLDLNSICPILHDAVVNLSPPEWLVWTAEDERRHEAELCTRCDLWLIDWGPHPDEVRGLISKMTDISEKSPPMLIHTNFAKMTLLDPQRQLEAKGATVELRAHVPLPNA